MFLYSNPWKEMEQMRREMESLFTTASRGKRYSFPPVNLYETDDAAIAEFIVPGMRKDEFSISFENGALVVKGEKKEPKISKEYSILREERAKGEFKKVIEIPVAIETKECSASLDNGVLTVTMPKAEESKPKQISIN